ncbi:MAG: DUF2934 domain-containing protein [Limisphaerales bacterium]
MKKQNKKQRTQDNNPLQENREAILQNRKLPSSTPEQIQKRAHEIFVARGGEPGRELDDWLQAERELQAGKHPFFTD